MFQIDTDERIMIHFIPPHTSAISVREGEKKFNKMMVILPLFRFYLTVRLNASKTVRRQPGHRFFNQFGDIFTVLGHNLFFAQTVFKIDMFGFRNGVFQIIVIV